jgi:hypothetical protein
LNIDFDDKDNNTISSGASRSSERIRINTGLKVRSKKTSEARLPPPKEMISLFNEIDHHGHGSVTKSELLAYVRKNPQSAEVRAGETT